MCVCERGKFSKTELKREKGAVMYVREVENNAGGRRHAKVSLLCMFELKKTPALPAVSLSVQSVQCLPVMEIRCIFPAF